MRLRGSFAVVVAFFLFGSVAATSADPQECQDALDRLRSAKSDVADALKAYVACLNGNDGHDDCSSEFSTLQSAQDDFESAVSEYGSDCD
jgi:hypothetical protein